MQRDLLDALITARAEKRPAVLATALDDGAQALILDPDDRAGRQGTLTVSPAIEEAAREALRTDKGRTVDTAAGPVFVQPFNPPLRMIIVGAVHIAQALAPMATLAGYDVTVIDPRQGFASPARFADITVRDDWPDDALDALVPDTRTAIVTLTHDPKLDDPALHRALASPAFYIGSLGSKKTHAARCARLTKAGFSEADQTRVNGPIGLAIGARSPAEIAIAILGQVTETLRRPPGPAPAAAAA